MTKSEPVAESMLPMDELIASLQDLDDEELRLTGLRVEGTLDEVDDPILLGRTARRSTPGSRGTPTPSG